MPDFYTVSTGTMEVASLGTDTYSLSSVMLGLEQARRNEGTFLDSVPDNPDSEPEEC